MSDWLRDELARHLGPVRAPETLWDRIQHTGPTASLPRSPWTAWAIAATLTLATAIGTYWLPGPRLREDVVVLAASGQPDLRDHPRAWDLRCAPPASRSAFRVTNASAQRGHQFTLAASGMEPEVIGCKMCHSIGLNQHHL